MPGTADNVVFAPPPEPAAVRGFVLAVIAHLLLLIVLSGLITWQSEDQGSAVEAELWSSIPQEAAPPAPAPPPPAPPQPEVQQPAVKPAPPPPVAKQPDIALEREKQKREEEAKRREEELRRQQLEKRKLEEQRKADEQRKAEEQRKLEEQHKLEEQRKLAEEKKKKEELAKKEKQKKELEAKQREQMRKDAINRMMAEASGTGSVNSRGTAARSAGPSDSYAGRIRARVKPNIVFVDDVPGNPSAEVEVRMAPDGTIVSRKITKASGVKSWDDAVLRALDKTETLPRDVDGRVHTPLIIEFKLRG